MRIIALTGAAMLAIAAAACNNNNADDQVSTDANLTNDAAANDMLGGNADMNAAMPTDANGFANAVAASDMYEMESGKLAADKASSADLKSFAKMLQTDHQKSSSDLKAAAAKANPAVTVTAALDAEKQGMLDQLKGASGADFDRMFIDQQTTAHQKALSLLQNYSSGGDSAPLKDFATKATTVVQGHLDHLNGMKK